MKRFCVEIWTGSEWNRRTNRFPTATVAATWLAKQSLQGTPRVQPIYE